MDRVNRKTEQNEAPNSGDKMSQMTQMRNGRTQILKGVNFKQNFLKELKISF
jgi:hypothetical protein